MKSFLNTGCFYPYFSITCQNVSWYSSENINNLTLATLSWKGYTTNVSSFYDFSWINYWLKVIFINHLLYLLFNIDFKFFSFFVSTKSYQNKYLEYEIWKKYYYFILFLFYSDFIFARFEVCLSYF